MWGERKKKVVQSWVTWWACWCFVLCPFQCFWGLFFFFFAKTLSLMCVCLNKKKGESLCDGQLSSGSNSTQPENSKQDIERHPRFSKIFFDYKRSPPSPRKATFPLFFIIAFFFFLCKKKKNSTKRDSARSMGNVSSKD